MSARDYLSEHTGYDRDDRKIFRLILRSSENRARKLIEFLKEAKGRLDLTTIIDRHGYTPLIFSIFKDRSLAAKILLDHVKVVENAQNPELTAGPPKSPRSSLPMQTMTLQEWINFKNKKESGMAAIHYVAFNGDLQLMKELIANGADPRQKNDTGMTALQFAAQGNQPAIITYLLDYQNIGINEMDNKKSSAVHWAIFNSNELALGFLLARKP